MSSPSSELSAEPDIAVLVISDRDSCVCSVRDALAEAAVCRVELAHDAVAVYQALDREVFAAILIDFEFKESMAIVLAEVIRGRPDCARTPLVLLTDLGPGGIDETALKPLGSVEVLFKPIEPPRVVSKVRLLLLSERQRLALAQSVGADEHRQLEVSHAALERQADDLRRSNDEIKNFAEVAAHDLRAPLRHIDMVARMLVEDESDRLTGEGRRRLEMLSTRVDRLSALVSSLLEYAQAGRKPAAPVAVSLDELVAQVVTDLDCSIEEQAAKITVGDLGQAYCSRHDAYRVVINLLSNAVKFGRPGVPPVIDVRVERSVEGGGGSLGVTLCVQDNGIGFEKGQLTQILRPLERLVGRDDYEGSGLGLSVVHRIMQRIGGRIEATSEPGKGSLFRVTFPAPT